METQKTILAFKRKSQRQATLETSAAAQRRRRGGKKSFGLSLCRGQMKGELGATG